MRSVLAVVTARGGSKALPGKNLANLGGRPLLHWTIDAALAARSVTRTVVSTDISEIAEAARKAGAEAPFLRPGHLATDTATGIDVIRHTLAWLVEHEQYSPDLVVHLQPTSPLRTGADIDAAVDLLLKRGADAVVGVTDAASHPLWTKMVDEAGWLRDFVPQGQPTLRRQDLPPALAVNGAIYLAAPSTVREEAAWFSGRVAPYYMPPERSLDIDTELDLALARLLVSRVRNHDSDATTGQ